MSLGNDCTSVSLNVGYQGIKMHNSSGTRQAISCPSSTGSCKTRLVRKSRWAEMFLSDTCPRNLQNLEMNMLAQQHVSLPLLAPQAGCQALVPNWVRAHTGSPLTPQGSQTSSTLVRFTRAFLMVPDSPKGPAFQLSGTPSPMHKACRPFTSISDLRQ